MSITVNGYEVNEFRDPAPWAAKETANFTAILNMMPTKGTTLVDGSLVPTPHKHSKLFDELEAQQANMLSTGFTITPATTINNTLNITVSASGAAAVAGSSAIIQKNGNCILNMLAPNASTNQIALGVVADNDWGLITSNYAAGILTIKRNSIGVTLGEQAFHIDNHQDNVNPINGQNGVPITVNIVSALTPAGGSAAFLVITHVDFSGGGSSGGVENLQFGTSDLTGAGSLQIIGTRNFAAGAPAGYGSYDWGNDGTHIQFLWTANAVGQTARVTARVISFNRLT